MVLQTGCIPAKAGTPTSGPFQAGGFLDAGFEIAEQAADDAPLRPMADFHITLHVDPHEAVVGNARLLERGRFLRTHELEQRVSGHFDEFHGVMILSLDADFKRTASLSRSMVSTSSCSARKSA